MLRLGIISRIAIILSCVALVIAPAAPAGEPEDCFRSKTNSERRERGIPALRPDARVDAIAERHSRRMAEDGTIYHNDNLGNELPPYKAAGENVGMGESCAVIHDAFMSSSGHRNNILDRDYTHFGVGVAQKDDILYVTIDFFTPKDSSRSSPPKRPAPPKKPTRGKTPTRPSC